jgi:RHS repeat-associated protein
MKILAAVCLSSILGVLAQGRARSQNYVYATGTPTFNTQIPIENGFINVNNGEIHIEIPLATQAQRGSLQLAERLVYDSRIWQIVPSGGSYSWQPTNVPNSMGGWRFVSGLETGVTSYNTSSGSSQACASGAGTVNHTLYSAFQWTDPSGTQHFFPGVTDQYIPTVHSCEAPPDITVASGYAVDGSGYSVNVSGYTNMTVFDPSGNQVYPIPTDTNGNYFSADSNGNLVDTLGRTPVLTTTSGNNIYYDVLAYNGTRSRYTVTTEAVFYHTAFDQSGVPSEGGGDFPAIQSIQLPDGSSYSFTYDSGTTAGKYGELTSVTLPTGGVIEYSYTNFLDSFQNENRWVHTRVKDGGTTTFTPATISDCTTTSGCQEQVTATSPAGNDTIYSFSLDSAAAQEAGHSWTTGITAYQGSATGSGTKLKGVNTAFTYTTGFFALGGTYYSPASTTTVTTLYDAGVSSQVQTTLDSTASRPSTVKVWDFYPSSGSAPASPLTETDYSYLSFFPSQITLKDGSSGNQVAQTNFTYDQPSATTISGLPNHNSASTGGGNLTTTSQWINASGALLSTTATYDTAGSMLTSTSPNGKTTYGHDATDTFVTSSTPPTPSSGVSLPTSSAFDSSSSLITSATDPNGTQTVTQSYDAFGRPNEIDTLNEGTNFGKTTYTYSTNQVSTYVYQNASVYQDTETLYDNYGRLSRVAVANGQSSNPWYQNDTCYDTNGNVAFQSYAYQANGFASAIVCSGAGDASTYDALGRVLTITHGDGTKITYSYQGRATKVVDENGVTRIYQVDVLGRTTAVCEVVTYTSVTGSPAPGACIGMDIAGSGYKTSYAYNLPSHMTTITQGVQTRIFTTDWAGRTISTAEPERGPTNYSYAYNSTGLAVTRSRPKANQSSPTVLTTTTTQYDSLSRPVSVTYNDGLTPLKGFAYDTAFSWTNASSATNLKGRLALMWSGVSGAANNTSSLFSYDATGNVTTMWECAPSTCATAAGQLSRGSLNFGYDWAGNLAYASDGASGIIVYGRSPAGEVTSITNQSYTNAPFNPPNLVSNIVNGPNGPLSYSLGNGLTGVKSYDSMGRVTGGFVCNGSSAASCTGGTQIYGFTANWKGSQLQGSCDTVLSTCSSFVYDQFNRLAISTVTQGPGPTQNFWYVEDIYGNRWQQNVTAGTGPAPSIAFNAINNQITTAGYAYDYPGNLTSDGLHTYTYDAEGNVLSVDGGATATYVYDAMNRRVRVQTASSTNEYLFNYAGQRTSTWQVSNNDGDEGRIYWDGQQIAFRDVDGTTYFDHQNWLGTERLRTNYAGATAASYVSLPWGDGYVPSVVTPNGDQDNLHFAQLEHDSESTTEHAQFRQYSSAQGRWMSPDPYNGSYDFSNPQSLNRYAYALNNPLTFTDPSGQDGDGNLGNLGSLGGCIGAAGSEGANVFADIGCGVSLLEDLFGLFGKPSFHGSLLPRPSTGNPNWDGNFGESNGLPVNGPSLSGGGIAGALGLPTAGCEFGGCGFAQGQDPGSTAQSLIPSMFFAFPYADLFDPNHRLFGTHYCGPGGGGSISPGLDSACAAHDACYTAHGLSIGDNFRTLSGAAAAALNQCNQDLCDSVRQLQGVAPTLVDAYFSIVPWKGHACHP